MFIEIDGHIELVVATDPATKLVVPRFIREPHAELKLKPVDTIEFFEKYGELINFVCKTNKSIGSYHTTHHLVGVAWLAYVLGKFIGVKEVVIGEPMYLDHGTEERVESVKDLMDILIPAALFHDYHHPAGYDDAVNINTTLKAMAESGVWGTLLPPHRQAEIERTIRQTQWPIPDDLTLTKLGGILRDADQLYASYFFNADMSKRLFEELGPRFEIDYYPDWLMRNLDYVLTLRGTFNWLSSDQLYDAALPTVVKAHLSEAISLL